MFEYTISGSGNGSFYWPNGYTTNLISTPASASFQVNSGDGLEFGIYAGLNGASRSVLIQNFVAPIPCGVEIWSQTGTVGDNSSLGIPVDCNEVRSFQWWFDGNLIPGATNATLTFTNLQLTNAGAYSIVVSNSQINVTNSAILQVLPFGAPSIRVNKQLAVGVIPAFGSAEVSISGGFTNGFIFCTLDGTVPTPSSALYGGGLITLTNTAIVQALGLSGDFSQSALAPPVTVQFTPLYDLQAEVVGSGTISVNPATGPYLSNSVVTVTATADPNWGFDHWAGDASGNQNPLTLAMNGPRTVEAVFVVTALPLTVSALGGGAVTANGQLVGSGTFFFPIGRVVTLNAVPYATNGWSFLQWQGDASGTDTVATVQMTQPRCIQALFGTTLSTTAVGGGSIWHTPISPLYPYGSQIRLGAIPAAGNYFVLWGSPLGTSSNPVQITLTNPAMSIAALFQPLSTGQFALATVADGSGSVGVDPALNRFGAGASVTLTAFPDGGQAFIGWSGDATGNANPLTVIMDQSRTITATFTKRPNLVVQPCLDGLSDSGFRATVIGEYGQVYSVEGSIDLVNWQPVAQLTNTYGATEFTDSGATNPSRFYRASQ
jgi:hypothetical protein